MKLEGLTVNFLGDSITEGLGVSDIANNRYDNVLKADCGLKEVRNYGICGTRIAHQFHPSAEASWDLNFCGRAGTMDPDADVVVVFGGTNDYSTGDAPFGLPGDTGRGTYCGAVRWLMDYLAKRYPDSVLVFMTPARRVGHLQPTCSVNAYNPDFPLRDYVKVIVETAKEYPIHILDLYNELGIDPDLQEDLETYTVDGLHFNDAGHHIIAKKLEEFLRKL